MRFQVWMLSFVLFCDICL